MDKIAQTRETLAEIKRDMDCFSADCSTCRFSLEFLDSIDEGYDYYCVLDKILSAL